MKELKEILEQLKSEQIGLDEAQSKVRECFFSDQGEVKIDHDRMSRCGFPEAIYCEGKTVTQIKKAATQIIKGGHNLLATRADIGAYQAIKEIDEEVQYNSAAGLVYLEQQKKTKTGFVVIVTAGAADTPVAEEAAITAQINGSNVQRVYDAGVAGIHRLLYFKDELAKANVVIAVAGMEGALPSVVGGLVSVPVIAVPTSIGYGASFEGVSALLTMLNSCAPNVSVVNIDNGFGAGHIASIINRQSQKSDTSSQLPENRQSQKSDTSSQLPEKENFIRNQK